MLIFIYMYTRPQLNTFSLITLLCNKALGGVSFVDIWIINNATNSSSITDKIRLKMCVYLCWGVVVVVVVVVVMEG